MDNDGHKGDPLVGIFWSIAFSIPIWLAMYKGWRWLRNG